MSLGDLQAFITEQEKLAIRGEPEREDSPVVRTFRGYLDDSLRREQSQERGKSGVKGMHHVIYRSIHSI